MPFLKHHRFTSVLVAFTLAFCTAKTTDAQSQWTVTLTSKQAAAYNDQKARNGNKAFAISPDGAWGYTFGMKNTQDAQKRAIANCRKYMRKKQRDCLLFATNGNQVLPSCDDHHKSRCTL